MELALIVTTVGRVRPLRALLQSLDGRLLAADKLVIVAQGAFDEVAALVAPFAQRGMPVKVTQSGRGASLGRNTGVAALGRDGDPLLVFPNDTTWFPPGAIESLRALNPGVRAAAATIVDENGSKFRLPSADRDLDRRSVWTVIEVGLLMRRGLFCELGGFDPCIGTGAATPWQAGEATDLLLRLLKRRPDVSMHWLPAEVWFGGVSTSTHLDDKERRRKLRCYGRGLCRLMTRWEYPLWWRFAFVGAGLLVGIRHRDTHRLGDGPAAALGRLEGLLGRTLGSGDVRAVTR